jgi:serine/threonine-protein kinase
VLLNNRYEVECEAVKVLESQVLWGQDIVTNRQVVIKSHKYQGGGMSIEKEILKLLNHEHLPILMDVFSIDDIEFIVLNRVEGQTLDLFIDQNPIDEQDLIYYMCQLCETLLYLHDHPRGIVHGDITPQNVLINDRGHVSLIDFGAGLMMDYDSVVEEDYISLGTIGYTAPEKILYPDMVGRQSDVYSVGTLIKYCLERAHRIYSLELTLIANKARAIQPDHRYKSIQQMKDDLQLLL